MKVVILICFFFAAFVAQSSGKPVGVRFINAISNSPDISVYLNHVLAFNDLDFAEVTQYRNVDSGIYDIRVVQENTGRTIYEINEITLADEQITLLAHGSTDELDEFPYAITKLVDDNDPNKDKARVRMYHTAANIREIDVTIDGDSVFENIEYTELTQYLSISEGRRPVSILDSRTGNSLIPATTLPFDDQTIVNLYFAGSQGVSTDSLTLIVAIDIENGNRETESSGSLLQFSFIVTLLAMLLLV